MSRKKQYAIYLLLFVLGLYVFPRFVSAQNVSVGSVNMGEEYEIELSSDPNEDIVFTSAGAAVSFSEDGTVNWFGKITMDADGSFNVSNPTGAGAGTAMLIFDGALSGSGNFTKLGTGTLEINNAEKFTGDMILSGGELHINSYLSEETGILLGSSTSLYLSDKDQTLGSLHGSGNVHAGTSGGLTFTLGTNNRDTIFNGVIYGNGGDILNKVGTGRTVLSGNGIGNGVLDPDTGPNWTINVWDGELLLNGNNGSTDINVGNTSDPNDLKTGYFAASGQVNNITVENESTLALGDRTKSTSSGLESLSVNNLELKDGSTLNIRIDSRGDSDELEIAMGGGFTVDEDKITLEIEAIAGDYSSQPVFSNFGTAITIADYKNSLVMKQGFLDYNWVGNDDIQISRNDRYFRDLARTHNQRELGTLLDRSNSLELWDVMTRLSDRNNDPADVRAAYDEITGSVKANSFMLGQWRTSRYGLNHLDLSPRAADCNNNFWLEIIHQTTDFDGDGNSGEFGISRTGFVLGSEERRCDTVFGFLVGYSEPYLHDDGDKFNACDLQFGFYGGATVNDILETKLFIGLGSQKYKNRRYLRSPILVDAGEEKIYGENSGNSMSMSLELAIPYYSDFFAFRPLVAIDSDLTWNYGSSETGNTGLELIYDRAFYDRTFARAGFTTQIGSVRDTSAFALLGRVFYEYQMVGDPYPVSRCTFNFNDPQMGQMEIRGVDPGRNFFTLGLGFKWNLDECRSFYGDYDFNVSDRSTGHFASLGYAQRW